jgi:hypothetical protein
MDIMSAKLIGMALAAGLGVIGPGIGIGILVGRALEAIGRNPEAQGKILTCSSARRSLKHLRSWRWYSHYWYASHSYFNPHGNP